MTNWWVYPALGGTGTTVLGAGGLKDLLSGDLTASAGTFALGLIILGATIFFAYRDCSRKDRAQEHTERIETETRLLDEIEKLQHRCDSLFEKVLKQQEEISRLNAVMARQDAEIQYLREELQEFKTSYEEQ